MAEDKTKHHVNESSADELEKVTGGAMVGTVNVALDGTSTCTLTGDIYVTSFTGDSNGSTLYVNGTVNGTPLSGTN